MNLKDYEYGLIGYPSLDLLKTEGKDWIFIVDPKSGQNIYWGIYEEPKLREHFQMHPRAIGALKRMAKARLKRENSFL